MRAGDAGIAGSSAESDSASSMVLSYADASQLVSERSLADYYETAAEASGNPRATANWIRSELLRELEAAGLSAAESPLRRKSWARWCV